MDDYAPVSLCPDCTVWAANNDDTGAGDDWLAFMAANPARRSTLGAAILTGDCVDFDTSECGGCDSRLAGQRCDALIPVA